MDLSSHNSIQPYANISIAYTPNFLPFGTLVHLFDENENSFMTPSDIERRIRANEGAHAAFVLGENLRYMWDTTFQFIGYIWDTTTQILSDIYSSFKSTRASHFMNEEDFDYEVHQNINAETCVEGYEEQCEKGYPQAIVLNGDYFRDSYGFEKFIDETLIENSPRNQIFLNSLAKQHRVHNLKISDDKDLCDIIIRVSELGPIRFLLLKMHGNDASIATTSKNNHYQKDSIDIYDFYYQNQGNQDLSCLSLMDENSVIILFSCNGAKEVDIAINDNPYTFPMSIQKLFALHVPQGKVFAADFYALKNSLVIKQDARSNMQVYAQGINSESYLYGGLDVLKTALHWYYWVEKDLNNPYLTELFLLKPLKEISMEKADFCKEVLPYFSMKRFCDKAKIRPSKQKLTQCTIDPKCEKAMDTLGYIQHKRFSK